MGPCHNYICIIERKKFQTLILESCKIMRRITYVLGTFHNQIKFALIEIKLFNEIIKGPFHNLQCKTVLILTHG